jgi:phosphatidylserine/phosphatidylglycerophosphate/cardiolipin synthase-like enzyme
MLPLLFALGMPAHADSLELILNDPAGRPAPADSCDVRLCTSMIELIDKAQKRVDFAFYGLRGQTAILDALKRARKRGVVVRGVVDKDVHDENYYHDTDQLMALADPMVTDYKVDFASSQSRKDFRGSSFQCLRPEGFAGPLQCLAMDLGDKCWVGAHVSREEIEYQGDIMHNKFVIVDERWVWTGSTNASDSGTGGYNANLVTVVDSPVVAGWYTSEMEQMLAGQFHKTKTAQSPMRTYLSDDVHVTVLFSPQHRPISKAVRPLIQSARDSIDIAVFFLTHKHLAQDLLDAHNRGVKVRVIIDATAAKNEYTKHQILREAGIPVKVEDFGGKMHAKSAVIDGEYLVTGSMNWTGAGENGNDENTILIRSTQHAVQYRKWFDKLWRDIDDKWLAGRPDPESRDSGFACMDGSDNDFDKLADKEDPGCSASPPPLPDLPPGKVVPKPEGGCRLDAATSP